MHGSRSGQNWGVEKEFTSTANYAASGIELGWNATIGHYKLAVHYPWNQFGWNARAASRRFIGVEFAQGTVNDPITDGQVAAFVHYVLNEAPNVPREFFTHAEVENYGWTGARDGKTDVFPFGDWRAEELKQRIRNALR